MRMLQIYQHGVGLFSYRLDLIGAIHKRTPSSLKGTDAAVQLVVVLLQPIGEYVQEQTFSFKTLHEAELAMTVHEL